MYFIRILIESHVNGNVIDILIIYSLLVKLLLCATYNLKILSYNSVLTIDVIYEIFTYKIFIPKQSYDSFILN